MKTQHEDAIQDFSALRENVRRAAMSKSSSTLEMLLNYYQLLRSVAARFPINEDEVFLLYLIYVLFCFVFACLPSFTDGLCVRDYET